MTEHWYEIETTKKGPQPLNYRGKCDPAVIERILSGELEAGWLKVDEVYYPEDVLDEKGQPVGIALRKFGRDGLSQNFTGCIYLRIEDLVGIVPMKRQDRESDMPGGYANFGLS